MDSEILKTMQVLARTKSFSKTAEILNLVQSTVSARIAELERTLGKPLFIRNNQSVTLTEAGLLFLPYAQHMVHDLETGMARLNSADLFDDRLVVSVVFSALPNFMEPVFADYLQEFSRTSLKVMTGHSTDILTQMVDGLTDLSITYQLPRNRRFTSWIIHEDDFVLVVPPSHPLAAASAFPSDRLAELDLIHHNWGGSFAEWIARLCPSTRWFHGTISSPSSVLSMVEKGCGPAILTRATVSAALAAGTVREIPLSGVLPPRWYTYLSTSNQQLSRSPVRHLLDIMARHQMPLMPLR